METYWDSHVDLLSRRLQKQTDKLKMRADEVLKERLRSAKGEPLTENFDREVQKMKLKVRFTFVDLAIQNADNPAADEYEDH